MANGMSPAQWQLTPDQQWSSQYNKLPPGMEGAHGLNMNTANYATGPQGSTTGPPAATPQVTPNFSAGMAGDSLGGLMGGGGGLGGMMGGSGASTATQPLVNSDSSSSSAMAGLMGAGPQPPDPVAMINTGPRFGRPGLAHRNMPDLGAPLAALGRIY